MEVPSRLVQTISRNRDDIFAKSRIFQFQSRAKSTAIQLRTDTFVLVIKERVVPWGLLAKEKQPCVVRNSFKYLEVRKIKYLQNHEVLSDKSSKRRAIIFLEKHCRIDERHVTASSKNAVREFHKKHINVIFAFRRPVGEVVHVLEGLVEFFEFNIRRVCNRHIEAPMRVKDLREVYKNVKVNLVSETFLGRCKTLVDLFLNFSLYLCFGFAVGFVKKSGFEFFYFDQFF